MAERWLWITPRVSPTLATGALTYSSGLAHAVVATGVDMTMVGLVDPSEADAVPDVAGLRVDGVVGTPRPAWRSLLSALPNQAVAGATSVFRERVAELMATGGWHVVVADGLQVAWATSLLEQRPAGCVRVLVTHNHETSMRQAIAAAQPFGARGAALRLEAWKTGRAEGRAVAAADVITSITDEDRDRFARDRPGAVHVVARPGWSGEPSADVPEISDRGRTVGIMGSFEWHAKQDGLRRFLAVADPLFASHGIELLVGGRMPDEFRAELVGSTTATNIVGWVDDPAAFLARCRLGIIAESLGGGFKLKALDYLFNRVPIACLSRCRAGLPLVDGESIVVADDDAALAAAVVARIDESAALERIAARAFAIATTEFSWTTSANALRDAVDRSARA